jgi:hypothetical protein
METVAILDFEITGLLSSGGDRVTACDHPSVICIPDELTTQSSMICWFCHPENNWRFKPTLCNKGAS